MNASIRWPSGLVQELHDLPINHRVGWKKAEAVANRAIRDGPRPARIRKAARRTSLNLETWLLAPIPAPEFSRSTGTRVVTMTPGRADRHRGSLQHSAIATLFDRHRDLTLPTSFLIDAHGNIVKVYRDPSTRSRSNEDIKRIPQRRKQRLAKALPFPGNAETYEFGRNNLSLGSAFFQRGYYDQAWQLFQLALRDDPPARKLNTASAAST